MTGGLAPRRHELGTAGVAAGARRSGLPRREQMHRPSGGRRSQGQAPVSLIHGRTTGGRCDDGRSSSRRPATATQSVPLPAVGCSDRGRSRAGRGVYRVALDRCVSTRQSVPPPARRFIDTRPEPRDFLVYPGLDAGRRNPDVQIGELHQPPVRPPVLPVGMDVGKLQQLVDLIKRRRHALILQGMTFGRNGHQRRRRMPAGKVCPAMIVWSVLVVHWVKAVNCASSPGG